MPWPDENFLVVSHIEVELDRLNRTLGFLRERARQNHGMHASWNEGAAGDFATCTRGDCTEARGYLVEWGWDL